MKIKIQQILQIIGLVLILYFINSLEINLATLRLIKEPKYIAISATLFVLTHIINAVRMKYFLKSIDNENYDIKTLTRIEFISKYIYNITPSKIYLPAKAILISKLCATRKSISLAIVSFEYILDAAITITLALFGTLFLFKNKINIESSNLTYLLGVMLLLTITVISTPSKIIDNLFKRARNQNNKHIKRYTTQILRLIETTRDKWRELIFNKKMQYILPITIIQLTIMAASTKLIFLSMATDIPLMWIIAINASVLFIGGISQIPGGIGAREGAGVLIYGVLGIPKEITIIALLITRMYTIIPLILGYWYFMKSNIKWRTTS